MGGPDRAYLRGVLLSATGMVVISPDGLLLRLVDHLPVWTIVFYRSLAMGLVLAAILTRRHGRQLPARVSALGGAGALSVAAVSVGSVTFVGAIVNTSVANTLLIVASMPLFSAVIGRLLIAERVRPATAGAIAAAVGGVAVIVHGSLGGGTLLGDGLALVAAVSMGLNLVVMRRSPGIDALAVLCLSGCVCAALAVLWGGLAAVALADLAVLVVLGGAILPAALFLFFRGTRYVPAAEVALLALIETALGPLWAWLVVGETPPPNTFVGGAIVFAAILVNALSGFRR